MMKMDYERMKVIMVTNGGESYISSFESTPPSECNRMSFIYFITASLSLLSLEEEVLCYKSESICNDEANYCYSCW